MKPNARSLANLKRTAGPGRPKMAKTVRDELVRRYGPDAKPLVDRLDVLSRSRNPRVALSATELLLAYHSYRPSQAIEHTGANGGPVIVKVVYDEVVKACA